MLVPMAEEKALKLKIEQLEQELKEVKASAKIINTYNKRTIALADASPNSIFQLDKNCCLVFANRLAKKLMKITDELYIGKHITNFVDADVANDIIIKVETTLKTGKKVESVFNVQNRFFKIVVNLITFENDREVLIVTNDITEQIKYETQLKYNSGLLTKIFDESNECIIVVDFKAWTLLSCNKKTRELFGFNDHDTNDEILSYFNVARKVNPSEEERLETLQKLEIGQRTTGYTVYVSKNGNEFDAYYEGSTIILENQKLLIFRITDVTEITNANKQLLIDKQKQKLHIEQSPLGYLEWDSNFCIVAWNPAAEVIFGFTKAEVLGEHATLIISDDEKPLADLIWKKLISQRTGSISQHYNINKNGELLWMEWHNTPLYDESGQLLGISCLFSDLSEKKKSEQELNYKTTLLETVFEESQDGIMLFKPGTFEVVNCNKKALEIFEAKNISELNIHMPNARRNKQSSTERTKMNENIETGSLNETEIEVNTFNGNTAWITASVKIIQLNNVKLELARINDVSKLKKVNSQLYLDKQKHNIHIEKSPVGYVEWNNRFEVIEWNPIAEKVFGYTKQEALGKSAAFIINDNQKEDIHKIWQALLTHRNGYKGVYRNINKQKESRTIEWYDTPLYDDAGNILGVSSLFIDITEKLIQEEDIKNKNLFLETIYEEAFDAIMLFKPDSFEVLECNKRSFELFQADSILELNQHMPLARCVRQTSEERNLMFKQIQEHGIYDNDIEFLTCKGQTIWVNMLVKLIVLNGQQVELIRMTDVSELRKINLQLSIDKQKQRLQVEESPLGYIEWNKQFEVIEWNPSAEKIFDYTKSEALGKHASFIIPEDVLPMIDSIWDDLKNKKGGFRSTNINITKGNKQVTLEWYNTPLFRDGKFIGVSSLIDDITDKLNVQKEIEKQLKEKEVLLSEIHHRVKNNLAIISGLLFMHSEHIADPSVKQILKESQSRIKSMAIIHEQLYQTENFGNVNLRQYLKELIKKIATSFNFENKEIDIDVEVGEFSMPISQALMIGLIINELVINSYKYAFEQKSEGQIKVRFEKKAKYILRVSDTGIGYSENYNFEKSNTLGLNLVKILSKQLKGDVLFENKNGAYCTLIFGEV
jgi:PAS domain S-box-containing protein